VYRKYRHREITFSLWYAFAENFMLPLSHDEVVYGKRSLLAKMPGDDWQRFANLRTLYGYMWAHPGKKLLFMGGELGVPNEWSHEGEIDWSLTQDPRHFGMQRWVQDLNRLYRAEPALYELDFIDRGFEWIDSNDYDNSVLSFVRRDSSGRRLVLVVANFTPVPRPSYTIGVPRGGHWEELLNSDAPLYGGSGQGNLGGVTAAPTGSHGRYHSLSLTVPPLGVLYLRNVEQGDA
jgi:1,4-alpha-glucan branching enzyme